MINFCLVANDSFVCKVQGYASSMRLRKVGGLLLLLRLRKWAEQMMLLEMSKDHIRIWPGKSQFWLLKLSNFFGPNPGLLLYPTEVCMWEFMNGKRTRIGTILSIILDLYPQWAREQQDKQMRKTNEIWMRDRERGSRRKALSSLKLGWDPEGRGGEIVRVPRGAMSLFLFPP